MYNKVQVQYDFFVHRYFLWNKLFYLSKNLIRYSTISNQSKSVLAYSLLIDV